MTPVELLRDLRRRGIAVRAVGDELRLRPARLVSPDLVETLKAAKTELLAILGPPRCMGRLAHLPADQRPATLAPDGSCTRCDRHIWIEMVAGGYACAHCQRPDDPRAIRQYVAGIEFVETALR